MSGIGGDSRCSAVYWRTWAVAGQSSADPLFAGAVAPAAGQLHGAANACFRRDRAVVAIRPRLEADRSRRIGVDVDAIEPDGGRTVHLEQRRVLGPPHGDHL